MTVFGRDSFTRSGATTPLASTTPEVGGSWVSHPLAGTNHTLSTHVSGGVVFHNGASALALTLIGDAAPSADQAADAPMRRVSDRNAAGNVFGVAVRCSASALTYYRFVFNDAPTDRFVLDRSVGGAVVELGFKTAATAGVDTSPGQVFTLGIEIVGDTIRGLVNGVEVCRATDSMITDAGHAGIVSYNNQPGSASFHTLWDAFDSWTVDSGPAPITGDGAAQLGALTASGGGAVAVVGTGAPTLGALTAVASGAVAVTGAAAADLRPLTATGAAALAVAGTGAAALHPLTTEGAGAVQVQGSGAATLGALTAAGAGTVTDTEPEAPPEIPGSGTATLGALSGTAAGTVAVAATGAADLAPITTVAVGAVAIAGDGVATLAALDSLAAGGVLVVGLGAATLSALTASGAGTVETPEPDPWPPTALTVGRITIRPLLSVGALQARPLISVGSLRLVPRPRS